MSIVSHLECPEFKGKIQKPDKNAGNSLHFYYNPQGGHGTGKTGNLVLTFSRQGKQAILL